MLSFSSIDPAKPACDGFGTLISPFIFSYLFISTDGWQLEPDLAASWDYDPHSFTWLIHIREDVLFHDGKRLNADDVKHSLETILKTHEPTAHRQINRIEALDASSLSIKLNQDDPDFLRKIWGIEIIPRRDGEPIAMPNYPVGSGPFRFEYIKGQEEVGLAANDQYYRGSPGLKKALFYFIPDTEKSWARLLSGETDIAFGIEPKDFQMMARYQDRFHFCMNVMPYRTLLLLNTRDPLLADLRVRMALSYAVDKEYIVKTILGSQGIEAIGAMGHNSPFHNPGLLPIPHDPQKSLELLRDAGWLFDSEQGYLSKEGRHLQLSIYFFQEIKLHERIAQYLRLCLSEIGIKASLQALPYEDLFSRYQANNAFQCVLTGYPEMRSENLVKEFWSPMEGKPALAGCFHDPRVTELINDALRVKDPLIRRSRFRELDSLLTSLHPAVFLCQERSLSVLSKRLRPDFSSDLSMFGRFHLWRLTPAQE